MKKKLLSIVSVILIACIMTGCMRIGEVIDTTKSKTQYSVTADVWFNKEKVDLYASGGGNIQQAVGTGTDTSMITSAMTQIQSYPVVTLEGKQYYKADSQKSKEYFYPKNTDYSSIVTTTSLYAADASDTYKNVSSTDSAEAEKYMADIFEKLTITVKFKDKITKTNGKLSKNKKTATFTFGPKKLTSGKKIEIYAYTADSDRSLKADRILSKKSAAKEKKTK